MNRPFLSHGTDHEEKLRKGNTSKVYTSSSYLTCERERTRNFFVKLVKDVVGPLPLLLELPDP